MNGVSKPWTVEMYAKVLMVVLGILSAGFMTWAGIVWQGLGEVRAIATEVATMRVVMEQTRGEQRELIGDVRAHMLEPWHKDAGHEIETGVLRLKVLEKELATLQQYVDQVWSRLRAGGVNDENLKRELERLCNCKIDLKEPDPF